MIDMYAETCLHEASHAVVAMSMGVTVTRLAVESLGDKAAGECYLPLPDDPLRAVAILLAGTLGVSGYGHMLHDMPGIEPKQPPRRSDAAGHMYTPARTKPRIGQRLAVFARTIGLGTRWRHDPTYIGRSA